WTTKAAWIVSAGKCCLAWRGQDCAHLSGQRCRGHAAARGSKAREARRGEMSKNAARLVHVVGSVPFSCAEEVFQQLSGAIGPQSERIPDGETGERLNWIMCQAEPFKSATNLEVGGERQVGGGRNPRYKRKDGSSPGDVRFPPLGYSRNALA